MHIIAFFHKYLNYAEIAVMIINDIRYLLRNYYSYIYYIKLAMEGG